MKKGSIDMLSLLEQQIKMMNESELFFVLEEIMLDYANQDIKNIYKSKRASLVLDELKQRFIINEKCKNETSH